MAIEKLTKSEILAASQGLTKEDLINAEILKLERQITNLRKMKRNITSNEILRVCPKCKTMNLHWNLSNDTWTCAFC